jgi:hypothetical protein
VLQQAHVGQPPKDALDDPSADLIILVQILMATP